MPVRSLPLDANLQHLKFQAKDLLKEHAARTVRVAQRIREFHPRFHRSMDVEILNSKLSLSDAQLTIAREYGFPSWTRLKRHIETPTLVDRLNLPRHERVEDVEFRRAVALLDAGDVSGLDAHLQRYRKLVHQHIVFEGGNYFRNPTLLEFVAENPVRHGTLPANLVAITRVILDAGAEQDARNETLLLVASGSVARDCREKIPLIDLLCEYGADPNTAIRAAAFHGEIDGVNALIQHGAHIDITIAAALGSEDTFDRLLPNANSEDRHLAFAMAAQYGRVGMVRSLLEAGEDPNRYNPVGGHSHATPLHQAAGEGHDELVRLLVEHGARLDMKDVRWHATPADWAQHAGRKELVEYLHVEQRKRKAEAEGRVVG